MMRQIVQLRQRSLLEQIVFIGNKDIVIDNKAPVVDNYEQELTRIIAMVRK